MNITPTRATNAANLLLFRVDVAYRLRVDIHQRDADHNVLGLKVDWQCSKDVEEAIKTFPQKSEPVL